MVKSLPNDRVVALDPCNADNNVARRITDEDCTEIIAKSKEAWETLSYARNHDGKVQTLSFGKKCLVDRLLLRNNDVHGNAISDTFTIADIGKVIDCFAADLDMNAQSTGLLTRDLVKQYAADVKAMAQKGYLLEANIVLRRCRQECNTCGKI